jgi:hypothetical protein
VIEKYIAIVVRYSYGSYRISNIVAAIADVNHNCKLHLLPVKIGWGELQVWTFFFIFLFFYISVVYVCLVSSGVEELLRY